MQNFATMVESIEILFRYYLFSLQHFYCPQLGLKLPKTMLLT